MKCEPNDAYTYNAFKKLLTKKATLRGRRYQHSIEFSVILNPGTFCNV